MDETANKIATWILTIMGASGLLYLLYTFPAFIASLSSMPGSNSLAGPLGSGFVMLWQIFLIIVSLFLFGKGVADLRKMAKNQTHLDQ